MSASDQPTQPEQPVHGQLYVSTGVGPVPEGTAALYVRTEQPPGGDRPLHFLTLTRDRIVLERWEDPEAFSERWAVAYTPPVDPDEAHGWRRERDALAATLKDVPAAIIAEAEGDLDLKQRTSLGRDVRSNLAARFREHRAAAR